MPCVNLHLIGAPKQCILTGHFTTAASENDTDKRRESEPEHRETKKSKPKVENDINL